MIYRTALIVDDHPLFCDALSMTLKSIAEIEDIHAAATLAEAMQVVRKVGEVDIVFLDLNLPDVEGMDGLVRLKNAAKVPVVVVSSMVDDRLISLALRSGASGFVPKHSQREVFRSALDTIERGETFVPNGYVVTEEEEDDGLAPEDVAARLASLTNQQARILQLICQGKLNKQIAYDLSIAETTVKAHITAILRKLGVQSRTQAVLLVKVTSFANVLK